MCVIISHLISLHNKYDKTFRFSFTHFMKFEITRDKLDVWFTDGGYEA